jgi:hypothetical protein
MMEDGETFLFNIPKGWMTDADGKAEVDARGMKKDDARTVEWMISGVHIVGTLRGNRGSEKAHQWKEKMGKKAVDTLRAKPLVPDRVKVRVTDDSAQVMTVSIFDKKGFQMVDTVHNAVVEKTKPRRIFDRELGRPGYRDIPITETQDLYNQIMGYVDLDDLIAWFYR